MHRRRFVSQAGALSLLPVLPLKAEPYDRVYPDMLAVYLVDKLNQLAAEWDQKRAAITTAEALHARNRDIRRQVVEMVGGFPDRNPLGPEVVKVIERKGYRVENVMFQSRPNFWVTGNLYVPAGASKVPAIISPCGHYPLARMLPSYQLAYLSLVKAGFVVLAFDPIGQGERRQYWNPETDSSDGFSATMEHSMPGQLQILLGQTLTGYRVWDAMRAVDYLLTRPEVDGTRIGCTGHSGGGTLTMFTSAVDERIACAVVHEGGTRGRWPIQLSPQAPLGPSDVEQNLFPGAARGIDHPDLHIAVAPRPLLATIEHYSASFNSSADKIRARYKLLGLEERFATVEAGDPHAFTYKLRRATTDWFSRWLLKKPGPTAEPELTPEKPEDLRCLPNGSLRHSRKGETVWTDLWAKASVLPPAKPVTAATVRQVLRMRDLRSPLQPRAVETVEREAYTIEKLQFLSEPGIYIPTWVFQPRQRLEHTPAILYFNESGKDSDGMEFENAEAAGVNPGVLATLTRRGYQVIAADVRGIGETRTPHRAASGGNPFSHLFDTETAMTYMTWFLESSLFGMRVQDVLRTVDYALSRADARAQVWVIGKDMGALLALFAAALDPRIVSVICQGGLLSYRTLVDGNDRYLHGANILTPGLLRHFDLPQVASLVQGRLTLVDPVDAMKRRVAMQEARGKYSGRIRVETRGATTDLASLYANWLAT